MAITDIGFLTRPVGYSNGGDVFNPNIASQDLDLRGGGSIIGEEQSGFIKEIGTELYHQMLEEEINLQKSKINSDFVKNKAFNLLLKYLSKYIYLKILLTMLI